MSSDIGHIIIPVILSGGSGKRLWPMSSKDTPKQFLNLIGELSLFQETAMRALDITGVSEDRLVIITLDEMRKETLLQLAEIGKNMDAHILTEPEARNTAAAIAFAALYVRKYFGENSLMMVMPSDHYIGNVKALKCAVDKAAQAAKNGYIVTFGITPSRLETGYGYILAGIASNIEGVFTVKEFKEKPPLDVAQTYIDSGEYFWNSGIFLFQTKTALEHYTLYAKDTLTAVEDSILQSANDQMPDMSCYQKIPKQSFDTAILESAKNVVVIPCNPDWSDIGTWDSLWEIEQKDRDGNLIKGQVIYQDTKNSIIQADKRLIVCIGVEDLVIVDTPESLMITKKGHSNTLKKIVDIL